MATMNISLPDNLKGFVQERIKETDFSNASDYIRALIRKDREVYAQQKLEKLLLEGMESGEPEPVDMQFWKALDQRIDD